jgi:hypothetical protein
MLLAYHQCQFSIMSEFGNEISELTLNRADQTNDHTLEGDLPSSSEQLPSTSFTQNESLNDVVNRKFAVLNELTKILDVYNDHLVVMAQSMREARLTPEVEDNDGEEVSGDSPTHSKRETIHEADKSCQRLKITTLEFVPGANAWKVSSAESEHLNPVSGYSVTLSAPPPRVRRALEVKTTILEFIPSANAWKASDAESEHMSPARGRSVALNTTPPRVRRASDRKQAKKDAWKQAILRFRKTYGTSD